MKRVMALCSWKTLKRLWLTLPVIALLLFYVTSSYGAELPERSLTLSDSKAGATATYLLGFTIPSPETLGSIKLQFCANDPIIGGSCTAPSGFNSANVVLTNQTGATGFSVSPSGTNANTVLLTRAPLLALAVPVSYTLATIVNPSTVATFFGRIQTFATSDGSGSETDQGGVAMSINNAVQINATVPPYLLFCGGISISGLNCSNVSGSYINFGDLTSSATSSGQSQLLAATNAQSGYGVQVYGSTMTSGNNIINAISPRDVSRPNTVQFGLNLVANQTPLVGEDPAGPGSAQPTSGYGLANWFQFNSGDTIANVTGPDLNRQFTVSYVVNVPSNQPPGVYASTLTYVCLANF